MIKIEHKRPKVKKCSIEWLASYLDYLADVSEKDHGPKGMVLLPGRNCRCEDDTPAAFLAAVLERQVHYLQVRDGKEGKRSPLLWGELIYNLGKGVYHTAEERDYIEKLLIDRVAPNSSARAVWHINPKTGFDDLHILMSAKTLDGLMTLRRTKVKIRKRLNAIDQEIADYLNSHAHPDRTHIIITAAKVAKEKAAKRARDAKKPTPRPLPEQIASMTDDEVTVNNLPSFLEKLGIIFEIIKERTIKLTYPRRIQVGKYHHPAKGSYTIRELLLQIAEAQFDIRLDKKQRKEQNME
jgi:hypothetical protein